MFSENISAFYELILVDLAFGRGTVYFLGLVFTCVIAAGCAVSSQVTIFCNAKLTKNSIFQTSGEL